MSRSFANLVIKLEPSLRKWRIDLLQETPSNVAQVLRTAEAKGITELKHFELEVKIWRDYVACDCYEDDELEDYDDFDEFQGLNDNYTLEGHSANFLQVIELDHFKKMLVGKDDYFMFQVK